MIVLPNSFERYLASLRNFVSLSILKHGLQQKHFEKLKKIYFAEAILNKKHPQSVDLFRLCFNLLSAVSTIKNKLNFCCEISNNYYINKKLFIFLLVKICESSNKIKLFSNDNFIIIIFNGQFKNSKKILNLLNAIYLQEIKNRISLVAVPIVKTKEKSVYIESEWEYLFDKFSIINLYFGL